MTITYCHLLLSHNLLNFLIMRMWSNVTLPSITINDIQYLTTYELSWSSMFGESLFAMKWWTAWLSLSKAAIEMEWFILSRLHIWIRYILFVWSGKEWFRGQISVGEIVIWTCIVL